MADTLYDSIVSPGTWPTPDEVRAARAAGFGRELPYQSQLLDDDKLAASIVANRSPVSSLGLSLDPSIARAIPNLINNEQLAGHYDPRKDTMRYDPLFPSALAHESTHRGFNKLYGPAGFNPSKKGPNSTYENDPEELYARYLINQIASGQGEFESDRYDKVTGNTTDQSYTDELNKRAEEYYGPSAPSDRLARLAGYAQRDAAEAIRQRKPYGGPR